MINKIIFIILKTFRTPVIWSHYLLCVLLTIIHCCFREEREKTTRKIHESLLSMIIELVHSVGADGMKFILNQVRRILMLRPRELMLWRKVSIACNSRVLSFVEVFIWNLLIVISSFNTFNTSWLVARVESSA